MLAVTKQEIPLLQIDATRGFSLKGHFDTPQKNA